MRKHTVGCFLVHDITQKPCGWTGYKKDTIKKVIQDDSVEDGSPLLYEWCPKCKGGIYKEDGTVVEIDLLKEYL
jgi:hypothetical protein